MKPINCFLIAVSLAGCTSVKTITTTASFDAGEAETMLLPGNNTIKGSALIRQVGGGIVNCAGRNVTLAPATYYADERVAHIYGTNDSGFRPASMGGIRFDFEPPQYSVFTKQTTCDAQGYFKFEKLKPGTYYISTVITWQTHPYVYQGGAIFKRVYLKEGEPQEIVISP